MENTYRISDVIDRRFLKLPLSLFADPEYRALSAERAQKVGLWG